MKDIPQIESLDPRAITLLRQVQQQLREHPETYDQDRPCGSACCICGWMAHFKLIGGYDPVQFHFLTYDQYKKLFWVDEWPTQFFDFDACSAGDVGRIPASDAILRIDHFIATDGKE